MFLDVVFMAAIVSVQKIIWQVLSKHAVNRNAGKGVDPSPIRRSARQNASSFCYSGSEPAADLSL
jgi:hypothetical protein